MIIIIRSINYNGLGECRAGKSWNWACFTQETDKGNIVWSQLYIYNKHLRFNFYLYIELQAPK